MGRWVSLQRQINMDVSMDKKRAIPSGLEVLKIDKAARASKKNQKPLCIWLTGLSGSGKSTLARLLDNHLYATGRHCYLLDGDDLRHGLNHDLGFSSEDRVENVRRVAEVARLMVDAGLIVIVSVISPFQRQRAMARSLFAPGEFVEVFIDTPLAVCEQRDVKGLYAKARRGELTQFTGIDSPYEPPETPGVHLNCDQLSPHEALSRVLASVFS